MALDGAVVHTRHHLALLRSSSAHLGFLNAGRCTTDPGALRPSPALLSHRSAFHPRKPQRRRARKAKADPIDNPKRLPNWTKGPLASYLSPPISPSDSLFGQSVNASAAHVEPSASARSMLSGLCRSRSPCPPVALISKFPGTCRDPAGEKEALGQHPSRPNSRVQLAN